AGTAAVAKATPDGYTLMVTSNGHTVAGLVSKNVPFDPVKDFSGITRLGSVPLFLIANPNSPAKNLKELIALAKEAGQAQLLLTRACQHDLHCGRTFPEGSRYRRPACAL